MHAWKDFRSRHNSASDNPAPTAHEHHALERTNGKSTDKIIQPTDAVKKTIGKTLIKSIAGSADDFAAVMPLSALMFGQDGMQSQISDTSDVVMASFFALGTQVRYHFSY
jgi:hypothetical protein